MNVQNSLIWELMLYEYKVDLDTTEATKRICCVKGEDAVDHSTVTRWSKKFSSGCKNLDDQARSSRPKTMDSKTMLQAIEASLASCN